MDELIKYLQNIQTDLVGIIIPAIITAIVAILTLIINNFTKVYIDVSKYNHDQYKTMRCFYQRFKPLLLDMTFLMLKMEKENKYDNMAKVINKYWEFKNNPSGYRTKYPQENIDDHINVLECFFNICKELYEIFRQDEIPSYPMWHPIIKIKVNSMLLNSFRFTYMITESTKYYNKNLIDSICCGEKFAKVSINGKQLKKYCKFLDKWYMCY